jgi:hypothetical protein
MNYLFLTTALVLLLSACSTLDREHIAEGGRSETGEPALHAIHDNELRDLMDRMDSLMQERFMTETQLDNERRKYSHRIADSAQDLSKTIDTIIAKLPSLALSPAEQTTFLALANKLRQQTELLQQQASQNRIDAIDDGLHQINTTCTSCHALFRKTGG